MSGRPAILIIGGRLEAIHKAKDHGLAVALLQHKERLLPGQAEAADLLLLGDYTDWSIARPLALAAHHILGYTRAVSVVDQGLETIGLINDLLGLEGTSHQVAHRFKDKLAMRRHLAASGAETVAAGPVGSAADLAAFGALHGYPLILKPLAATASRGVFRVDGPDRVDEAWQAAAALQSRRDLTMAAFVPVDRFLAEQYIDGPEYSVESCSFQGRHVVVAITEKLTEGVLERGHALPARLAPAHENAIVDYVTHFLDVMELKHGTAHTELRLTADGPRVIESHNRVPGGRIMDLVNRVYGVDLELYAVAGPFGLVPELPGRPVACGAAATRFLSAEAGEMTAVTGLDEARALDGVLDVQLPFTVGDEIPELEDNFYRIGQVVCAAGTTAGAVDLCEALTAKIEITTRREPRQRVTRPTPVA